MSSMLDPVGPEDPSVYWRRRAVVGVGLLVALLLLWWLFSSLFGSDDAGTEPTASGAGSSAPIAAPTSAAPTLPAPTSGSGAVAPTASAKATSPAPAAASEQAQSAGKPPRCSDDAIAVVVTPAAHSAQVGDGMKLTLTVSNTGSTSCRRDVSAAANELRVVSGRVLVWSSDYCKGTTDGPAAKDGTVTLEPDQTWKTTVRWPGKVTSATCPADQPTAKAGTYRALGSNGEKRSAEAVFTLA